MPDKNCECPKIINEVAQGIAQAAVRELEDLGAGLIINLIKDRLESLGIPFELEDIEDFFNSIINAPDLILGYLEYDGDIVTAFLKNLSLNEVALAYAIIYLDLKELRSALSGYRKALDRLLIALNKWEIQLRKEGAAEKAYQALSIARRELDRADYLLFEALKAEDFSLVTRYAKSASASIEAAKIAICKTPQGESVPSIRAILEIEKSLIEARTAFLVASSKYSALIEHIEKYGDILFSFDITAEIKAGFKFGSAIYKPAIVAIRKIIQNLLKQRIITCSQMQLLHTAMKGLSVEQKQEVVDLLKDMKIATAEIRRAFSRIKEYKTEWEFKTELFDKNAMHFKKGSIQSEVNSILQLISLIDAVLENSIFKQTPIEKIIEFLQNYLDLLKNIGSEEVFRLLPEIIDKIKGLSNFYEAIENIGEKFNKILGTLDALENPFFSGRQIQKLLDCINSPSPLKVAAPINQEAIEVASEVAARFLKLYDVLKSAIIKTFEKFNISLPAITFSLRKISEINSKIERISRLSAQYEKDVIKERFCN